MTQPGPQNPCSSGLGTCLMGVGSKGRSIAARQPEVCNLQGVCGQVHEDVVRLQVSVQDAVHVAEVQPCQELVQIPLQHSPAVSFCCMKSDC